MRCILFQPVHSALSAAVLVLITGRSPLPAQEPGSATGIHVNTGYAILVDSAPRPPINADEIKTLDQVRQLESTVVTNLDRSGFADTVAGANNFIRSIDQAPGRTTMTFLGRPQEPREAAMKKIEDTKAELQSGGDRTVVEPKLRTALAEYFIADMQHRVRELDEIKAKVAETETKLQKRLDNQKASVELQVKLLLQEADGLGFFPRDDIATSQQDSSMNKVFSDAFQIFGRGTEPGSIPPGFGPRNSMQTRLTEGQVREKQLADELAMLKKQLHEERAKQQELDSKNETAK